MKFTCLGKGGGFHYPPCHMLETCGFRILFDFPLDLSALRIFSPVPTCFSSSLEEETPSCLGSDCQKGEESEKPLIANDLIYAEPWYKTVKNLHLWNAAFIDVVLISSPMGMLGLPFLTRMKGFSAKIYATEATARLGQLMMEELVSMHMELRQIYGAEESDFPQWMKWKDLELLPSALRERILGKDGGELGGWMPLYSAVDVKDCIQKVQALKYAEATCYNGTLVIKAFSSGLEIGGCNWTINCTKGDIGFISSSIFVSGHAMDFDYCSLKGNELILFSDFSSLEATENLDNDFSVQSINHLSPLRNNSNNCEEFTRSMLAEDNLEEREKLAFLCSCVVDSVKSGGSVLIPINRLGIVLQLLEQISDALDSSNMKIPIYIISSVAEELLAFTNIIPEWLCKQRQEKLFSGQPLFDHVKLVKDKKLHVFPAVHSSELLMNWQEPCIVFSPHWSLRLGPAVHLLQRWCGDQNSLLLLENGVDAELALLPFKPMAMKVLQCSFLSGIKLQNVQPLLETLQAKFVLFPEELKQISFSKANSFSLLCYSENETLHIPRLKESSEVDIAMDLASQFHFKKLKQENISVTRLNGELSLYHGKHRLLSGNKEARLKRPLVHWGSLDVESLQKFEDAVFSIKSLFLHRYSSASPSLRKLFYSVICRVATVLKTRYTSPGFWAAGLGLFEQAQSLVTDASEKNHLQSCIAQAKEVLHQVHNPPEPSNPSNGGYLFEGHLTVDPEPPQPQWLVQANLLNAAASLSNAESSSSSSLGPVEQDNASENATTLLQSLIENLDSVLPPILENERGAPRVPPASKEVVAKLPVINITEEVLGKLGKDAECAICKENLVVNDKMQELPCKHTFHPPCLRPWLDEHNSCPICRHELQTDDHAYESWKEREKEAEEERKGAANAIRGGEYMYV